MSNILDDVCEQGPLLKPEAVKAPNISKATIQRCISKLSPYWSDEQLDQVVETGFFDQRLDFTQRPTSNAFA